VASKLRTFGVGQGDIVGGHMERTARLVATLLGIWRSGAAYLPLDPEAPSARLAQILEGAEARAVITEERLRGRLPPGSDPVLLADWGFPASFENTDSGDGRAGSPVPQSLAYVMYTSGSTGHPKGVEVSHLSVRNLLESVRHVIGFRPDDCLLAVSTYSFDISVLEFFLPLLCGGRIVLGSNEQVKHAPALLSLLSQTNPTVMQATPSMWRLLRDAGWQGHPQLRIISGGEELTPELASWLIRRCGAVFNGYGPTEATIYSSFHEVTGEPDGRIPIGRPLSNTSLLVLAGKQQLAPPGVPGELYIGGAGVALGYRGRPDLTRDRFLLNPLRRGGDRLYRTGDRVAWRKDGSLDFLGRVDNQVQVRGHRVEPGEVEAALEGIREVARAAVVAKDMGEGDLRLVAYVVFEPGSSLTGTDIRRALRALLPEYMMPGIIEPLGRMPLTSSGKVDRRALPDPLRRAPAKRDDFLPPETSQEVMLADVWQQLLRISKVGKTDNFFDLGGHSLLTMRVVAKIERLTGFRMDSRVMFFQNLEQIAATLPPPVAAGGMPGA
ncbi:MAG: non-ribosomal peptide synthetase, partial [Chromatiales bacterium]|nr:non-ribosomal peptide synthetase [Chromatiales bacterium]